MKRLNPDSGWLWSPRPPLCLLQHPGSVASVMLSHREEEEEEEEEEGEHPAACCYITGHRDVIGPAADAHWSTSEPPVLSGILSSGSGLTGRPPGAPPPSLQPKTVSGADGTDASLRIPGARYCERRPGTETQGCVCVYGQREPGRLGSCWPGSPYVYGVRRNLVVGVEVVEEVAVEDTLEVITEDIYTDDVLDPELLQHAQLYPT